MSFSVYRKIANLILLLVASNLSAQVTYYDAAEFQLLGKATAATTERYVRLPDSLEHISRLPLWQLSRNSSGMAVVNFHMDHMTDVAVKGLDLYCLEGKNWYFVNSARPIGKSTESSLISGMEAKEREFMIYLPLYDGLVSLSIGIDAGASINQPAIESPVREKPVVFYGTSILQGGCASRPGMAHTNIISRRLNRECINLGFSGNAFLDLEVAKVIAEVEASVFVLDFVPNASVAQMKEVRRKNDTLKEIFNCLKKINEKNIILISSKNMLGEDGEATVDGIHFTDLGMMRYADLVCPIIKKAIK